MLMTQNTTQCEPMTSRALTETADMSEQAKARQMRKAVSKLAKQDRRAVTTVAIKKGGGGQKLDKKKATKEMWRCRCM